MPEYASMNALSADMDLPPVFTGQASTEMRCVGSILRDVQARGWVHHIPRLMVLGNLALIAGINPQQFTRWMWDSFVDAAEWVMVPNVVGMSSPWNATVRCCGPSCRTHLPPIEC